MILKIKKIVLLCICSIFLLIITGCNLFNREKYDPSTFDTVTGNLFISLIGGDELTCNYYFEDRSVYGLEDYEPSLPTPSLTNPLSKIVTNLYFTQALNFEYDLLNPDQKMTYNIIDDLLYYVNNKTTEMGYLSNQYLGTYLGYQAQLPLLLEEYNFRCKKDVDNYLKFLELVPDTFKKYYEFEVKKSDNGYGMPDNVIDNVIGQCEKFILSIDDATSMMFDVIEEKIDNCDFLTIDEKNYYKDVNHQDVIECVRTGYEYIKNNLNKLKGKATNKNGLAGYVNKNGVEIGKNYYQNEFQHETGYLISCDEAIEYLEQKINNYIDLYVSTYRKVNSSYSDKALINKITSNEERLFDVTPIEQLNYYSEMIKSDFPSLAYSPKINVKYIHESMADNFSPAAYMTSAIDNKEEESIYLNPASIYKDLNGEKTLDYFYLYTTLAHEGLPGHLYQSVYVKGLDINPIRKVLRNSGYTEGWATYCENYVFEYLRGRYPDNVIDYFEYSSLLEASLYSRLELGIHYNGWSFEEAYIFFSQYYNVNRNSFCKVYSQLCEIPTNYQKYFFTYLKFVDLYNLTKNTMGEEFNVLEFHKTILDCGSAPLRFVEDAVKEKFNID